MESIQIKQNGTVRSDQELERMQKAGKREYGVIYISKVQADLTGC